MHRSCHARAARQFLAVQGISREGVPKARSRCPETATPPPRFEDGRLYRFGCSGKPPVDQEQRQEQHKGGCRQKDPGPGPRAGSGRLAGSGHPACPSCRSGLLAGPTMGCRGGRSQGSRPRLKRAGPCGEASGVESCFHGVGQRLQARIACGGVSLDFGLRSTCPARFPGVTVVQVRAFSPCSIRQEACCLRRRTRHASSKVGPS